MKPAGSEFSKLVNEIARLFDGMESMTYYEFLAVEPDCDYVRIRDAFYDRAQRFHPDRFVGTHGAMVKKAVYAVYKRMTEAYNVLSDPDSRHFYSAALAEGKHRLDPELRSRRLTADERKIGNPFARRYAHSARAKLASNDADGAFVDVELARSLEDAEELDLLHSDIVRAIEGSGGRV